MSPSDWITWSVRRRKDQSQDLRNESEKWNGESEGGERGWKEWRDGFPRRVSRDSSNFSLSLSISFASFSFPFPPKTRLVGEWKRGREIGSFPRFNSTPFFASIFINMSLGNRHHHQFDSFFRFIELLSPSPTKLDEERWMDGERKTMFVWMWCTRRPFPALQVSTFYNFHKTFLPLPSYSVPFRYISFILCPFLSPSPTHHLMDRTLPFLLSPFFFMTMMNCSFPLSIQLSPGFRASSTFVRQRGWTCNEKGFLRH